MRLICPNCDAQYEVDDTVIPDEGRDVQCSSCGQTWFQESALMLAIEASADDLPAPAPQEPEAHPEAPPEAQGAAEAEPEPEPDQMEPEEVLAAELDEVLAEEAPEDVHDDDRHAQEGAPERQKLDDAVLGILREEAEREGKLPDTGSDLETQPGLGLDDGAVAQGAPVRQRTARLRGIEPETDDDGAGSRRDLLPDIEEINSTLRAASERAEQDGDIAPEAQHTRRKRSGFRMGFGAMLFIFAILIALYAYAPKIVETVPLSEGLMSRYVTVVDGLRDWLDAAMQRGIEAMNGAEAPNDGS